MKNMESRIVNMLVNREYETVEKQEFKIVKTSFYQFITKEGGIIRVLVENKLFLGLTYEILCFVPNKEDYVNKFKITKKSEHFKMIDSFYNELLNEEKKGEQLEIEEYFK